MYVICPKCGCDEIKYISPLDPDSVRCDACDHHFSLSEYHKKPTCDHEDVKIDTAEWPTFLEHGKLYDCLVDCKGTIEQKSIIPLAKDPNSSRRFVMTDARRLFSENPGYVREIIEMDFEYIMNDGIREDYPFDYEALTVVCKPLEDGTFIEHGEGHFYGFVKTDII
jgi:hypothetical protein